MPAWWRRLLCRWFGHCHVEAGVPGLVPFDVCIRCGKIHDPR